VLYNLIEWNITLQRPFFFYFVNLKKAYDNINREALWFAIMQQGIPNKLVGLLAYLHQGTSTIVKAFGAESTVFDIHGGVRQGCNITITVFNLYLDFITKQALTALGAEVGVKVTFKHVDKQLFANA
jgi:hypothetical protein